MILADDLFTCRVLCLVWVCLLMRRPKVSYW